jgi:hypothetical protein
MTPLDLNTTYIWAYDKCPYNRHVPRIHVSHLVNKGTTQRRMDFALWYGSRDGMQNITPKQNNNSDLVPGGFLFYVLLE